MRWGMHWRIGRDSLHGRSSLAYQLGTILPDWFERQPIHRKKESMARFLKRADRLRFMKPGIRRDWLLGTLIHYLCDYCCLAHEEEYYRFYRHRVYEVDSQILFKQIHLQKRAVYLEQQRRFTEKLPEISPALSTDAGALSSADFQDELCRLIQRTTELRRTRIDALGSEKWWVDPRIMLLDVRCAYQLCGAVMKILSQSTASGTKNADASIQQEPGSPAARLYEDREPYVYISYRHGGSSEEQLRKLVSLFEQHHIRFWYDDGLNPEDKWKERLYERISHAHAFIALLSDGYYESSDCMAELSVAMNEKIPLIPIVCSPIRTGSCQYMQAKVNLYQQFPAELPDPEEFLKLPPVAECKAN